MEAPPFMTTLPDQFHALLSLPFRGETIGRPAHVAAADMLAVLDTLNPADWGSFRSYDGAHLPW